MPDINEELREEIARNRVILYMKGTPEFPQCGFSATTVQILQRIGKPFASVDVLSQPEKRAAIKTFSNWPTIPQLYVGGKFVGGCDIIQELYASGELQELIESDAG